MITSFTGTLSWRAAAAARAQWVQGQELASEPGTEELGITRMFSFGTPNIWARTLRAFTTAWVVSYRVKLLPSHKATVAWSSMGLCVSAGRK